MEGRGRGGNAGRPRQGDRRPRAGTRRCASDLAAGANGLLAPVAALGALAAVAVPAYMEPT